MKNNQNPKKRTLNQAIALAVIGITAVVTWFNNEKKEQKPVTKPQTEITQKQSEPAVTNANSNIAIPSSLGYYDTVMSQDNFGQNIVPVDYYMLSLSWSPSFCEDQKRKNGGNVPKHLQLQCNEAAQFGWVIHGLWPQSATARSASDHPRFCQGDLPVVSEDLIKKYLPESPGAKLLQGQWEKHGSCAFENAESYFAKQKELFRGLNLPGSELSRKELFQWMKKFNPQLKNVRLESRGNELYICYDKQWNPTNCR